MEQIPIIGSQGKPILYAYLDDGNLKFQFEYYGSSENEMDYEFIHAVAPQDFESIAIKFGLDPTLGILVLVQQITDAGRGEELKDALNSKEIPNELWTWFS